METLYRKLYGLRSTVLEYWIIYLVSVVMNYLGEGEVISGEQTFWQKMLDLGNAPVFILLVLTVLMTVYYILLVVSGYYTKRQEPVAAFTELMKAHSDESAHANCRRAGVGTEPHAVDSSEHRDWYRTQKREGGGL